MLCIPQIASQLRGKLPRTRSRLTTLLVNKAPYAHVLCNMQSIVTSKDFRRTVGIIISGVGNQPLPFLDVCLVITLCHIHSAEDPCTLVTNNRQQRQFPHFLTLLPPTQTFTLPARALQNLVHLCQWSNLMSTAGTR